MITHRDIRRYIGQHIHCHTHFGTFQGVIVHISKHHIILGSVTESRPMEPSIDPMLGTYRFGPGPGGPMGPGPGGPGGPGGGPGGGWQLAIPLAAIIGITAVGMHWW